MEEEKLSEVLSGQNEPMMFKLNRPCSMQALKWQVKKFPETFSAQKLQQIVSRVCHEQNVN